MDAPYREPMSREERGINLGTRKSGMVGVSLGGRLNPKHGRKAKRGQPLGGRGGRVYRAR